MALDAFLRMLISTPRRERNSTNSREHWTPSPWNTIRSIFKYNYYSCQSDSVLLRFLYANNFDIHYAVQHFTDYLEIMWELNVREYPAEIDEYNNLVEIVGRDEMLRPIIYINLALLKETDDPLIILRNIMIHLVIMEEYMFAPGKIETWIAILNPNTTALHILNLD